MKRASDSAALRLAHTCALAVAVVLMADVPGQAQFQERTVDVGGLAASHVWPAGSQRSPTAVIIAGSGPTDRDGNGFGGLRTDAYKLLAHALAAAGIATVRYDKRGVGGSSAIAVPEPELTVEVFARDAAAVAAWAAAQPGAGPVSLIGHSEGGLIALLAAGAAEPKAIVLLAAAGRSFGTLLREQLSRPGVPPSMSAEAMSIIAALERGERVATVSPELAPVFRPSVQGYLISLMRVDPIERLRSGRAPLLVIGGGKDVQISRADFDALAAARPDAESFWAPTMGHTLKGVGEEPDAQQRAYADPRLPLQDGLAGRIAAFLHANSNR